MTAESPDLEGIAHVLAQPPFNRLHTADQLGDELSATELLAILNAALLWIVQAHLVGGATADFSSANAAAVELCDSLWRADMRSRIPEETALQFSETLDMLQYKGLDGSADRNTLYQTLLGLMTHQHESLEGEPRKRLLHMLSFLCTNVPKHCKRARLAVYLKPIAVPPHYEDDEIAKTRSALQQLQEQFVELDKTVEQERQRSGIATRTKRDIRQLDDELEQLKRKIARAQTLVASTPNLEQWQAAARRLHHAKTRERQAVDKIQAHNERLAMLKSQLAAKRQQLQQLQSKAPEAQQLARSLLLEQSGKKQQLQALEEEHRRLETQVAAKRATVAETAGLLPSDERRQATLHEYETRRGELRALRKEFKVLARTEQILREQLAAHGGAVLTGDAASAPVPNSWVSKSGPEQDSALLAVSQRVEERQKRVATMERTLGALKNDCSRLASRANSEKTRRRSGHDDDSPLDASTASVAKELDALWDQIEAEQTRTLSLAASVQWLEGVCGKVQDEEDVYRNKIDERLSLILRDRGFKTHREFLTRAIADGEKHTAQLKAQRQAVEATFKADTQQIEYFSSLLQVFQAKEAYQAALLTGAISPPTATPQPAEENRLVL